MVKWIVHDFKWESIFSDHCNTGTMLGVIWLYHCLCFCGDLHGTESFIFYTG